MAAERITSRANPLMTHIRRLAASRSYRRETGEFLGDGVKLLAEAARWGAALTAVVYTPGVRLPDLPAGLRLVEVPEDLMASVSPMEAPQGALFLAAMPSRQPPPALTGSRYLALEGVQDPGNVGAILRTADAFAAGGLLLLPGCADLYNPKTVRASMGALFRLPAWECTLPQLSALARALAPRLLLMTATISVLVTAPTSMESKMACRLVPPPDTQTAALSIALLPFRLPCNILPDRLSHRHR